MWITYAAAQRALAAAPATLPAGEKGMIVSDGRKQGKTVLAATTIQLRTTPDIPSHAT
jgi:hypothetical protein